MAKRKTKKVRLQYELDGVLLILVAIIGYLKDTGIIGRFIRSLSVFFVGVAWQFLLVGLLLLGIYMIFKKDIPHFFGARAIGLYFVVIAILSLMHLGYIENNGIVGANIFTTNIDMFMNSFNNTATIRGSGFIGSLITLISLKLLDVKGTTLLMWVLLGSGLLIFTGTSIADLLKNFFSKFKIEKKLKVENASKADREEILSKEKAFEEDTRIVVSSMDELINNHDDKETVNPQLVTTEREADSSGYNYPPISLLVHASKKDTKADGDEIKSVAATLEQVFNDFEIQAKVVAVNVGPSVTQYEMDLKSGTKVNRVLSIHKEIALALAAKDVRIQAPIPGKKTIGVEIPNRVNAMVSVREILESIPKSLSESKLMVVLGKNIMGRPVYAEINNTPHLLVAGATGSGKSVCINSMIISLLMRAKPDEVKLVLVDPKKVELSMYNGVPHLLTPVVTDARKANIVLKKITAEMERRYDLFSEANAKNIAGYNTLIEKKNKSLDEHSQVKKLPYIVVIIDELADLMLVAAKEVEDSITRITQMARAAGIHLIVATQRPSTDVITGLIKANIPSRISFAVSSSIDSRTILDMTGAEKLLGKGDMLFLPTGENMPIRVQGTYITDEEIKAVVDYTISQQKARYDESLTLSDEDMGAKSSFSSTDDYDEPLYNEIVEFVVTQGKASASLLQRRFRLGYNRAARAMDILEERGIVGPSNGAKPREVLVKLEEKE